MLIMTFDDVEKVLAPFADPATRLDLREIGDKVVFRLTRKGNELQGSILKSSGLVSGDGIIVMGIKQFLASPRMANLETLAQTQERVFDVRGLIERSVIFDGTPSDNGLEILSGLAPIPGGSTRVVILSGPAGMGKTKLVESLVKARAANFIARKDDRLCLLISSRGRRLSLLSDVIAGTLGDLRAPIIHHEVPALVRAGLLDLVIDGFDELVNADGYHDAWESVGHLLRQIGSGGLVILSARDAFFSEQEFVARARKESTAKSAFHFSFMEFLPLSDVEIRKIVSARKVAPALVEPLFQLCMLLPVALRGRPFFVERLAERVAEKGVIDFESPLTIAIDEFVGRESRILFGEEPTAVERESLYAFFEEVAIEMRRQEKDTLDVDSIHFFLDLVLEGAGVLAERRKALVHRAEALAFMEVGESRRRGFPHEVVRDHFVSRRIVSSLDDPKQTPVRESLGVGTFSLDLADAICRFLDQQGREASTVWIQRTLATASDSGPAELLGQNALALALALARRLPTGSSMEFEDLTIGNSSFADSSIERLTFHRCSWASLDLTGCDARAAAFRDCTVGHLRISADTVVPNSLVGSTRILLLEDQSASWSAREIREPDVIKSVLQEHCQKDTKEELKPGQALLVRLANRWRKTGYLEVDPKKSKAFADPLWPKIREILERHGRLEWEDISTRADGGGRARVGVMRDAAGIAQRWHRDPAQRSDIEAIWNEAADA